jgi:hypothetical protein
VRDGVHLGNTRVRRTRPVFDGHRMGSVFDAHGVGSAVGQLLDCRGPLPAIVGANLNSIASDTAADSGDKAAAARAAMG